MEFFPPRFSVYYNLWRFRGNTYYSGPKSQRLSQNSNQNTSLGKPGQTKTFKVDN